MRVTLYTVFDADDTCTPRGAAIHEEHFATLDAAIEYVRQLFTSNCDLSLRVYDNGSSRLLLYVITVKNADHEHHFHIVQGYVDIPD